jgi:hypothetical protein
LKSHFEDVDKNLNLSNWQSSWKVHSLDKVRMRLW